MNDIEETRQIAESLEGWLYPREGPKLYELAKACRAGVIVEIGSWKGKSTVWLARGALAGAAPPIYAIDPHQGSESGQPTFDAFQRNLAAAGVAESVTPVISTSAAAAADFALPIGLLFIDGDHSVEAVEDDLRSWAPQIVDGGVLAAHDASLSELAVHGPRRALRSWAVGNRDFGDLQVAGTIVYATRGASGRNSLGRLAALSVAEGLRVHPSQPACDAAFVVRHFLRR